MGIITINLWKGQEELYATKLVMRKFLNYWHGFYNEFLTRFIFVDKPQ